MKRTHSTSGFQSQGIGSRSNSMNDLPFVAIAGMTSRVSIGNITSASQLDLQDLFRASISDDLPLDIEAVEVEGGWTWHLVLSAGVALLSALAFGYNNGNMNTQAAVMRDALGIPEHLDSGCVPTGESAALPANDVLWGFCVSGFCLSALLGSTVAGQVADRHGRRLFLLGNSAIYLIGAVLEAASGPLTLPDPTDDAAKAAQFCAPVPNVRALSVLLLGRLLTGVACGGSTVAVPMYLGETAPAHLRGTLGSAFLLTAVTGMLFGQIAGLPSLLGTKNGWPWILLGAGLPAALQLLAGGVLLESPRWLLLHGRPSEAAGALAKLRGCSTADVELIEELESMGDGMGLAGKLSDAALARHDGNVTLFDAQLREPMIGSGSHDGGITPASSITRLSNLGSASGVSGGGGGDAEPWGALQQVIVTEPAMRKPLCICLTLMAAQQLSGINNAFNYSSTFFVANGMSAEVVTWIAIAMNLGNVIVVFLSTVLMDRAGRRVLLLTSMGGMVVAIMVLTVALLTSQVQLVVVGIVLFVTTFGLGLGPVVWLLPAELFPMSKRAPATAAVTSVNWLANFVRAPAAHAPATAPHLARPARHRATSRPLASSRCSDCGPVLSAPRRISRRALISSLRRRPHWRVGLCLLQCARDARQDSRGH